MKQTAMRLCGVFLALLFGWMTGFAAQASVSDAALEKEIDTASAYLLQTVPQPEVGSVGGEWCVLGLRALLAAPRAILMPTVRRHGGQ